MSKDSCYHYKIKAGQKVGVFHGCFWLFTATYCTVIADKKKGIFRWYFIVQKFKFLIRNQTV